MDIELIAQNAELLIDLLEDHKEALSERYAEGELTDEQYEEAMVTAEQTIAALEDR